MQRIILAIAIVLPCAASAQLTDSSRRVVRMQGAVNFRDVGGYKTTEGRSVKWDKVFRSADVSKLSQQDLAVLEQKHIHTVVDFRGVRESQQAPDHLLPNTDYTLCPAGSDSLPDMKQMAELIKKGDFMKEFYSNTQYLGARYKPFFQKLLILPANESIMYHCTGGRDRTGMATALFLYALGVPQATIEADFTASNVYLQPMHGRMFQGMVQATGMDVETIKKALELRPEFIRSMFDSIKGRYGSVDAFFKQELGVGPEEIKQLRDKYTI